MKIFSFCPPERHYAKPRQKFTSDARSACLNMQNEEDENCRSWGTFGKLSGIQKNNTNDAIASIHDANYKRIVALRTNSILRT